MLEIIQLEKYDKAKYPRFGQYVKPSRSVLRVARNVAPLAAMAALLESCIPPFIGGKPLPPKLVTEAEARTVISQVFATANITLKPDVDLTILFAAGDSARLSLDGYNDSLGIGYEYIYGEDNSTFPPTVYNRLDATKYDTKPSILTMQAEYERDAYQEHLEHAVKGFLDSLRAHGII